MNHTYFQSFTVRVKVTEMKRIAMSRACAVEQITVMVDTSGAIDDFVTSITVNIADSQGVCAFTVSTLSLGSRRVKPTLLKLLAVNPMRKDSYGYNILDRTPRSVSFRRDMPRRRDNARSGFRNCHPNCSAQYAEAHSL